MNEDSIIEVGPWFRHEDPNRKSPSRLEVLTAANVEPALEAMLSCIERLDGRVRIVCERNGTILASGRGFESWIKQSQCLLLRGKSLKALTREDQGKLDYLFHVPASEIETVLLPRGQSGGHCIIRGAGLCNEALAITMQIADDAFQTKLADLHEAFGLTPSEMHVVELLQHGLGATEICEELGISVHTVRAHLRHCYDKLGVSSREELWQKLAPYRLN